MFGTWSCQRPTYSTFIPKLFTKNAHKSAVSAIFFLVDLPPPWSARVLTSIRIGLSHYCGALHGGGELETVAGHHVDGPYRLAFDVRLRSPFLR